MLPIGTFSQLTGLSAKALRHYHSQGLLVPARVDADTQFRWYTVDQIGRAGRILALRRAGLDLPRIRRLVDDPGLAPEVLRRHAEDLRRERSEQDRALAEASAALAWEPEVGVRARRARTAVTAVTAEYGEDYDTDRMRADTSALADVLGGVAHERGWDVDGRWWRSPEPVAGSGASRMCVRVCVPVAAAGAPSPPLPGGVGLVEYGEGTESYLLVPGPETLGGLTLALSHLFGHRVDGMFADVGTLRQVDYDSGVEFAVGLRPLETDRSVLDG
ncbi:MULTISPECIES: MerR family transcriptional regulator [Nocardiopsis]|uniref:DNA-binding transcriptional MerR regulator n=1 Tax=Nocardiopsis sinuspersici TaxID=501010 RepID=A0A1V3C5R4_9ACTN|nr:MULTISPECIES: helix-turn-helix domain-containing protein [Nocardiopsis]NYH52494.1 DNA-binding transcriptional MerR regulator [Nocardiopsis sinuspersici]OOC55972.1 MerR family transcriptional regulator [Nocardiopsis sinuspersici]